MQIRLNYETPYPDVNDLLRVLLPNIQSILEDCFVGMYLHGSLAVGDFTPERSDIDYLVVTSADLPNEVIASLDLMHSRIASSELKWRNFEGSYISKSALRRFDHACSIHPVIRTDGTFGLERHGYEWVIQRHIIREKGIVLAGPPPQTLIDSITSSDLRKAVKQLLQEWWVPQIADSHRLKSSEYQAYAILTMCRVLYTLHFGTVVSKPAAARWALMTFDEQWSRLIEAALAWKRGAEMDYIEECIDFIRFTTQHR